LRIVAKNREVAQWDQPIISSYGLGKIELICGRINGILHFHFKPVTEAGLYNFTELSPTICTEPGEKYENEIFLRNHKNKIISTVFQSDEGGRFFQNRTRYRIIDIGQADMNLKGFWLTLHQIQALSLEEGWFTNESRSAISLLLSWL
jgi:oxidase EvaA